MEEQITFNPRNSLRFLELIPDLEVWSEHLLKDEDPDIQVIGEDIRKIGELLKALIPEDFPPRPEGGRVPMLGKCDRIFAWRDGVLTKSLTLDTERSKRYYDLVRDIGSWGEELRASVNPRIEGIGVEVGLIEGCLIEYPGIIIKPKPTPPILGACARSLEWRGEEPE